MQQSKFTNLQKKIVFENISNLKWTRKLHSHWAKKVQRCWEWNAKLYNLEWQRKVCRTNIMHHYCMKEPGEGWLTRVSTKSPELCFICCSHRFTNSLIKNLCNILGFMVKQFFGWKVNLLYISFFVLPHTWPWSAHDVIQDGVDEIDKQRKMQTC